MNRGSILFTTRGQQEWIPLLKSIYHIESQKVSGPGSYHRDISDALWSIEDLIGFDPHLAEKRESLDELIGYLRDNNHILVVPCGESESNRGSILNGDRYITRVGEIVRLLGHTYEYWHKGRPGIEATRWIVEEKKMPAFSITASKAIERLQGIVRSEPGFTTYEEPLCRAIDIVVKGTSRFLSKGDWTKARFSEFQIKSTDEMVRSKFKKGHDRRTQILTAGVGSGKTIGFTMGMMISALYGLMTGEKRCHLFLYPRTALAKDQHQKLSRIASEMGYPKLNVHLEHMEYYKSQNLSVKEGIKNTYNDWDYPILIVTTLETLKRRLQHPLFAKTMARSLSSVVLDEIHLISDITGTKIVHLLERLKATAPHGVLFTGSSATVASPERHAATVFGVMESDVRVIAPDSDQMAVVGLVHHIFLKPRESMSLLGLLVNGTSILVHNRRNDVGNRPDDVTLMPKTIGFADNLDMLGRWNEDFRENERTEHDQAFGRSGRPHPQAEDPQGWNSRQRELPYALRFKDPLFRRLNAKTGKIKSSGEDERYVRIDLDTKGLDPCSECVEGRRISFGEVSSEIMQAFGRFVNREPTKDNEEVERFHIDNPFVFNSGPQVIGTLDLCPYLRSGTCFWFSRDTFNPSRIPKKPFYEFNSISRSRIYSSKVGSYEPEDDDLSSTTFMAPIEAVYGPFRRDSSTTRDLIPVDMVMASPSLEVGIDLENVTESFMFKAIRNVSSYRQKAGRVGREKGSDSINVTLLSSRVMDFHYYRQPRKLISATTLDPIPLKRDNPIVARSSVYMAIWDYLALHSNLPESITPGIGPNTTFFKRIQSCAEHIKTNKSEIKKHLRSLSAHQLSDEEIEAAISRTLMDLEIFMIPTDGILMNERHKSIADIVAYRIQRKHSDREQINPVLTSAWNMLSDQTTNYRRVRTGINHIGLGLIEEFDSLDTMSVCGWDMETLKRIYEKFKLDDRVELDFLKPCLKHILMNLELIEGHGNSKVLFFMEQFREAFPEDTLGKAHYLSYIIEDLPMFNGVYGKYKFPRLKNLFSNPYEQTITLNERIRTGRNSSFIRPLGYAPISEAMYSYIPGTWTYRQGRAMKVDIGSLSGEWYNLVADIKEMISNGVLMDELKGSVPAPPFFGGHSINLYSLRQITLERAEKYPLVNKDRATIVDEDEDSERPGKEERTFVKIPRCFLEGWTHITTGDGKPIGMNQTGVENMIFDSGKTSTNGNPGDINHPLKSKLLSKALWHERMEVIEYIVSVNRSYTSQDVTGSTIIFRDMKKMIDIGFGNRYVTEGAYLELNKETAKATVEDIRRRMLEDSRWASSSLSAFRAMVNSVTVGEGSRVSPFLTRDIQSILVYSLIERFDDLSFKGLVEGFHDLANNPTEFEVLALDHVRAKHKMAIDDAENEGGTYVEKAEEVLNKEAKRIVEKAVEISHAMKEGFPDLNEYLGEWISFTLLNTFGIVAFNSLQRLCGTTDDRIGYLPDIDGLKEGRYGVYLYDRDEYGNGCSETMSKYFHILYIQRAIGDAHSRFLPTEDFLTILEQELLQCPQFHTDIGALALHSESGNEEANGLPELGYVLEHSEEVHRISGDVWRKLGINAIEEAWKIPVFGMIPHLVARRYGLEKDDVSRATGICWNGCPECVLSDHMLLGTLKGKDYVDKVILDEWFKSGRDGTDEYKSPTPMEIANGDAHLDIGSKSQVCMSITEEGEKRLLRSVSLPFTIGFIIDRYGETGKPRLVIRDDDIIGMRLKESIPDGVGKAFAIGFGRLVWYDLLMTAYLDSVGKIDGDSKEIMMVFYDITDINFDDIGISEKMIESLDYYRRVGGHNGRIERLSDLIGWLSERGFRIRICIDFFRALEPRVREFLTRVRELDMKNNISISVKHIPRGSMHVKGLVTPVGALDGSANLTKSGVGKNDESVNHANIGTKDYTEIQTRLRDALYGAKEWTQD